MRIGLLTFHWADNYGALLQANALKSVLEELGHEVRVLPYAPLKLRGRDMFPPLILHKWKGIFLPNLPLMVLCSWYIVRHFAAFITRKKLMGRFRREHLSSESNVRIASRLNLDTLDGIVIGSDQVWNPLITVDMDEAYWGHGLSLPASCRLVSYAASMSVYPPEAVSKERMKESLGRFDAVSVREEDTAKGLKEDLGMESTVCLDPVFLFSRTEWERLGAPIDLRRPFLLVYDTLYDPGLIRIALKKAWDKNLAVIRLSTSFKSAWKDVRKWALDEPCPPFREFMECSVEQFVSCFIHADAVVSNSFHALVLSMRFHHPVTIIPIARKDHRLRDLLKTLDLILPQDAFNAPVRIDLTEEEWQKVDRHLDEISRKSIQYLSDTLS